MRSVFFTSLGNINPEKSAFWYKGTDGKFSSAAAWFLSDEHRYRDKHWKRFDLALTTKLNQWNAEQEYRIVLKSQMNLTETKDRLLKYRFRNLDGLIFGIKTPLASKLKAIKLSRSIAWMQGAQTYFYQTFYDPETKSIGHGLLDVSMYWKGLD